MSPLKIKPVIFSPNAISALPSESFPDPSHGDLTWRTLFTQPNTPTSDLSAGIAVCPPHTGCLCAHRHTQAELYYVLEGRATVTIDGQSHPVEKGTAVFIPGDAEHSVMNTSDEEFKWLYVFPGGSFGDVIYRFSAKARL
ncbi:cupin domain-containing protein [Aspergillus saccharolyticus JOP 1030-1]|uniref:RmlC-like cupin n=1 Tax=Aspergillus saccharolyticus JOP 1030-1 TaxID=1450539 RepID=A0A319AAR0_9EURO|nr:RmlC-like cupin [Aspergillus saccharolyticus JOP 1030-1]PYH44022.1 RmlC-like cupin [Aspergillus saccharolyticus JOP 1030-1]